MSSKSNQSLTAKNASLFDRCICWGRGRGRLTVYISLALLLFYSTIFGQAEDRDDDVKDTAWRLAKQLALGSKISTGALSEAQKNDLRFFARQLLERAGDDRIVQDDFEGLLLVLGDSEIRDRSIQEFRSSLNIPPDTSPFVLAGDPRIIEALGEDLMRRESPTRSLGQPGGDQSERLVSTRAAATIPKLVGNSAEFNEEVINWARSLEDLQPTFATRELVRRWWRENEQAFKARAYKAIRPPIEDWPAPSTAAVEGNAEAVYPSGPVHDATPVDSHLRDQGPRGTVITDSVLNLIAIAVACIGAAAGIGLSVLKTARGARI